jgi:class 3 adenylate cyclase/tetratricopeptide (TPR) repeat protein
MSPAPVVVSTPVVTFLIADMRGYTPFTLERGDEAAARLAAKFALIARETVAPRGGDVIELRGDEALAVFPSVRQALWAATELQGRCAQELAIDPSLPLRVGIGIDSGEAIPLEGGFRGAAVNLAARLASLADAGEILASETVVNLARKLDGLAYRERGEVSLKGFADPVTVVQVAPAPVGQIETQLVDLEVEAVDVRQRLPLGGFLGSLPFGPIVSRERELDRLLTAVDAVAAGDGQMMLVAGEPGVGKTRLAQEVTLKTRNRGFLIAAGRCYEPEQSVPYYPFLDALGMLFRHAPAAIRREAAHRWPYLGALLPDQIGVPEVAGHPQQDEQLRVARAAAAFLEAIAERTPIALLLDDLHCADGASLRLLLYLARHTRTSRILILGTYRDVEVGRQHPLEEALRELSREGLMERVYLRRLDTEGTRALIAATMGETSISREFADLVQHRTEGNPFFVQQVMRVLVERGDLYRENGGGWTRKRLEEIEVPESVRSVIGQRLSRLSPDAQDMLREASVLGQSFTFDNLFAMSGRPEEKIDAALAEASTAGLIRHEGKDTYAFDHALTQQALYDELTPRRRRRLHLAAGEALLALPEQKRTKHAPELAWHFLQSDDAEHALSWSLIAGNQAEAVFAHSEAERHYRTALELAHETDDRAREVETLEKLGLTLWTVNRYDEALEIQERALQYHRQMNDLDGEARITAQIGWTHRQRGTPEEGIARIEAFLERIDSNSNPTSDRCLMEIWLPLAAMYYARGRYAEGLQRAEQAGELAQRMGDNRVLAKAESRRGPLLSKLGRHEESRRVLEDAIPVLEHVGDLYDLSVALHNVAVVYERFGEFDKARASFERAIEVAERRGDPKLATAFSTLLAWMTFRLGDWDGAHATLRQAVDKAYRLGAPAASAPPLLVLAHLSLFSGDWEEAARCLAEGMAVAERYGDPESLVVGRWLQTVQFLLQGYPEEALTQLEDLPGHPHLEEQVEAWVLLDLAQAYLHVGKLARADETVAECERRAAAQSDRWLLGAARSVRGGILAQQSRWEEAQWTLKEAVTLSQGNHDPYAEALARYESGMMHSRKGEAQQAHEELEEALAIFQRLGARPYIERTEQALARLDRGE